ncbi:MAG: aminotransferase class IV [Pirellulales bacterium]
MSEPIAYLKGQYVPASECVLPIYDLGIVLGASVTDFLRTFHQQAYRIEDHVQRFYRSCKYARITPPVPIAKSMAISEKLIATNSQLEPSAELGLVYYITAGENHTYAGAAGTPDTLQPTYVQHTFPLRFKLWKTLFECGVNCITPAPRHWPPASLSSKIKHRNRLHMWIGQQEVQQIDPAAVPLFLDVDGNITETGGSNFVIYRNGEVISPRRHNILWGISLAVLKEILATMNIPMLEQDLQTYDVINAEEAWLPSTPYCLAPVTSLNGASIGDGVPGPMWREVLTRWSEIVGKDIHQEMLGHP